MEEAWSPEVGSAALLLHKEERHWWESGSGRNIILEGKLLYECTHNSVHIPAEVYKEYLNLLHHAKSDTLIFVQGIYSYNGAGSCSPALPTGAEQGACREPGLARCRGPAGGEPRERARPGGAGASGAAPGPGAGRDGTGRGGAGSGHGEAAGGGSRRDSGSLGGRAAAGLSVGERALGAAGPGAGGTGRGDPRAGSRGAQSVPPRGSAGSLRGA